MIKELENYRDFYLKEYRKDNIEGYEDKDIWYL